MKVFYSSPWVPVEWIEAHGLQPRGVWFAEDLGWGALPGAPGRKPGGGAVVPTPGKNPPGGPMVPASGFPGVPPTGPAPFFKTATMPNACAP